LRFQNLFILVNDRPLNNQSLQQDIELDLIVERLIS